MPGQATRGRTVLLIHVSNLTDKRVDVTFTEGFGEGKTAARSCERESLPLGAPVGLIRPVGLHLALHTCP